jgi:hypothetical protein
MRELEIESYSTVSPLYLFYDAALVLCVPPDSS